MEGLFAPWHIIMIGLLIVVVFGSKRLPDSARAIGQSMRILKAETRELHEPGSRTGTGDATADGGILSQQPPAATGHETAVEVAGHPLHAARDDPYAGQPLPGPHDATSAERLP